jgi:hypothetical protein
MPLADNLELDESAGVEAWRLQQLLDAGWVYFRAELLAARPDVDLHEAIRIVECGCDQRTALRILL